MLSGPPLPLPISGAASVPLGDTFAVVGGQSGGAYLDTVYVYDARDNKWALLPQRIGEKKAMLTSFTIPLYYVVHVI